MSRPTRTRAAFWTTSTSATRRPRSGTSLRIQSPFLDTRYVPGGFYYIPNTDWRVGGNSVGIAAGYEHESNGQDEEESRSIDTLFVRPYFALGDTQDFHWTFSPKLYVYLEKDENPDIFKYRGYGDYRFTYGKDDDWQMAGRCARAPSRTRAASTCKAPTRCTG